ncbi:hypothetical protein [Spongiivirga citrea]|uniref:Uncharacterized protein n=1 Tax=Spongiivirga citrea TaxID=1481457 RepID=A0A6M0CHC3_9FLAO|nr:hypothetical protein [Spongiivirga citrea]NER16373.1 hypothetical protein [Spongiivirga citrea]
MKKAITRIPTIMLMMGILFFMNSCDPEDVKIDKPDGTLTPTEATTLSKNFVKDLETYDEIAKRYFLLLEELQGLDVKQQAALRGPVGEMMQKMVKQQQEEPLVKPTFQLSASIAYSVNELDTYMKYAKQQADSLKYDLTGFRIYFGVFPKDKKYDRKSNELTVFISPTGVKRKTQEGNMFSTLLFQETNGDIPGIDLKEFGEDWDPPTATYPIQ